MRIGHGMGHCPSDYGVLSESHGRLYFNMQSHLWSSDIPRVSGFKALVPKIQDLWAPWSYDRRVVHRMECSQGCSRMGEVHPQRLRIDF